MLADGSEYRGRYGVDDRALADFHRPRLQVLADSGADLLACETIPCLREARVLSRLLQEEFPAVPAWMSFSCLDGARNCEGEDMGDCVAELNGYAQIVALGVNCTPPRHISPLLRRMRERTGKPLLVYPNSGEHFDPSNKQWNGGHKTLPLGEQARQWRMEGARLIGGCCRTGPDDIRGVAQCLAS
jgi:homocysteine S-methyltransferase